MSSEQTAAADGPRPARPLRLAGVALAAVVALLAAGALGFWAGGGAPRPGEDSVEAGFARDMQTHHAQAVQMALSVREKSTDPVLRAVAYDIATSQQQQAGQLYGWLVQWGLPQTSGQPAMAWMHADQMGSMTGQPAMEMLPDGRMPGMAATADLQRLDAATGRDAEILFLRLLITHHRAGVAMARSAGEQADRPEVVRLARAITDAQTAETEQLQQLLTARGQPRA